MNTGSAGAINGTATVGFVSDASNVGDCAPNCQLNLPSQNVDRHRRRLSARQPGAQYANRDAGRARGRCGGGQSCGVDHQLRRPISTPKGCRVTRSAPAAMRSANGGRSPIWPRRAPTVRRSGRAQLHRGRRQTNGTVSLGFVSTGDGTTGAPDLGLRHRTRHRHRQGLHAGDGADRPHGDQLRHRARRRQRGDQSRSTCPTSRRPRRSTTRCAALRCGQRDRSAAPARSPGWSPAGPTGASTDGGPDTASAGIFDGTAQRRASRATTTTWPISCCRRPA